MKSIPGVFASVLVAICWVLLLGCDESQSGCPVEMPETGDTCSGELHCEYGDKTPCNDYWDCHCSDGEFFCGWTHLECWPDGGHDGQDTGPCGDDVEGQCGLIGQCVECNTHSDCPGGEHIIRQIDGGASICTTDSDCPENLLCHDGICILVEFCSIHGECRSKCNEFGEACGSGEACVGHQCLPVCQTDSDCLDGAGTCHQDGHCVFERCSEEGICPTGFEPVEGKLVCKEAG